MPTQAPLTYVPPVGTFVTPVESTRGENTRLHTCTVYRVLGAQHIQCRGFGYASPSEYIYVHPEDRGGGWPPTRFRLATAAERDTWPHHDYGSLFGPSDPEQLARWIREINRKRRAIECPKVNLP